MSRSDSSDQETNAAICDDCGFVIDESQKTCPARDEGVCQP